MDFIGTNIVMAGNVALQLRDRTIAIPSDAWERFPDWRPSEAYGYQLDMLDSEFRKSAWMHSWLLDNGFEAKGFVSEFYDSRKWITFETRQSSLRLSDPLTFLNTFVITYTIGDGVIFIGKTNGILWVEELSNGHWESLDEMFAY